MIKEFERTHPAPENDFGEKCTCRVYGPAPKYPVSFLKAGLKAAMRDYDGGPGFPIAVIFSEFKRGFQEELEHGCRNAVVNVTCDEVVETSRIVLAHLMEEELYYTNHNLGTPVK